MSDAIADNLARIQARIAAALERRGPGPEVRLIGVGKKQPLEKLLAAYQAGLRDFGENYAQELRDKLRRHGYRIDHSHYAHGLHSPYWWLKCAVGVDDAEQPLVKLYHRLLVWDMFHRPLLTRSLEWVLDPLIGKSVVFYATNGAAESRAAASSSAAHRAPIAEGAEVANAVY